MSEELHRQATPGAPEGAMAYVRRVRESRDIKQRAVADALGMSPGQYSGMERNQSPGYLPRPDQLAIIAKVIREPEINIIRAAGFLSDISASEYEDVLGDDWIPMKEQIGREIGPDALVKMVEDAVEKLFERHFPGRKEVVG